MIVPLLVLFVLFIAVKVYNLNKGAANYPGPPPHLLSGNFGLLKQFGGMTQGHKLYKRLHDEYGGFYVFWVYGRSRLNIADPSLARQVMLDTDHFADRNTGGFHSTIPLSLLGLYTNEVWQNHRKLLGPLFGERAMRHYSSIFLNGTQTLLKKWENNEVDVRKDLLAFTADMIGEIGFGTRFNTLTNDANIKYLIASRTILDEVIRRVIEPKFMWLLNFKRKQKFQEATDLFGNLVEKVFATNASSDADDSAFNMITIMQKAGLPLPELKDETLGLLIAGHETTSHTLAWLFYTMASHPAIIKKLQAELDEVMGDRKFPEHDDVAKLKYTKQCINETLRLHSTVPVLSRECSIDTTLAGYPVKKGQVIGIQVYSLAQDSKLFPDPSLFNPERFAETQKESDQIPPFAFIPFGGGHRACIGRTFAMQEMVIVVASIFKNLNFKLSPKTTKDMYEECSVTLAPSSEIYIQFEKRRV